MGEPLVLIEDILATYRFLAHAGRGVTEVRVIHPGHGIAGIGFFDDEDEFVAACAEHSGETNVYAGIQPRPVRFLERAPNRIAHLKQGAKDEDIEWLTAIVVDLDPARPKDTASTDAELALAVERGEAISAWMESKKFLLPVRNMSGNGCQLWFAVPPLDLAPDRRDEVKERLRQFEARIRERFGGNGVTVDSIFNLSRIIKVIGTRSVKGEDSPERPHRTSRASSPFVRNEDAALLDAILKMPMRVAPPLTSATPLESRNGGHKRGPAPEPPIDMCPPARNLWEEGFPDRSVAIFTMVRYLMHHGLSPERLVPAVLEWDARVLGKLDGRDGRKYVEDCIRKIDATRDPGGTIAPPCRWFKANGLLSVENPCDRCHVLLDVEKAILDIAADLPGAELEVRLRPVLDAIASGDPSMDRRYIELLQKRFRLGLRDLKRSVTSLRAQRRREEEAPDGPQTVMRGEVYEDLKGYYVEDRDGNAVFLSSFCVEPTMRIQVEDGEIVVGDVTTDRGGVFHEMRFEPEVFHSRRNFLGSLRKLDLQWTGSDENIQGVQRILAARDVPRRLGTRNLGYVETPDGPRWVAPGVVVASDGLRSADEVLYVPNGSSLPGRLRYALPPPDETRALAAEVLPVLLELNEPAIVLPVLGWFFAAPLRPRLMQLLERFPILVVWGSQGSGKTSLIRGVFWRLCGIADTEPYSATETEFALIRLLSCTNSVPVFIDEFKPRDMPKARLLSLIRFLRRIYGGETEERGRPDLRIVSYRLSAPVCLAGEARPEGDPALLERLISVSPNRNQLRVPKHKRAFSRLRGLELGKLAVPYIQFLLGRDTATDLEAATRLTDVLLARACPEMEVPDRCRDNLRVMVLGLVLFEQFAASLGVGLPDLEAEAAVGACLGELVEGEHGVKSALDSFVEALSVLAHNGELEQDRHYVYQGGRLLLHVPSCFDKYLEERRRTGREDETNGLRALHRLVRENRDRGGYIKELERQVWLGGRNVRMAEIDLEQAKKTLDVDDFPTSSSSGAARSWGQSHVDRD